MYPALVTVITRRALPLLALLFAATSAFAQISSGGTPRSFSMPALSEPTTLQMVTVDIAQYLAEDAQAGKDEPYRFGAPIDVAYTLSNSGTWEELPDGGRLWRLRISSPGAYSLNLLYDPFYLPPGATLFLYNDDHSQVIGAFTSDNNFETGKFQTAPIAGDAIILEYYEPPSVRGQGVISIYRVVHAYRNVFGRPTIDNYGDSGSCNNNVNCPVGANWQTNKRGVAMILDAGYRICSGSLINNVRQDRTPYFLTANHCLGGETGWMFMFNYESPGCTNQDGPTNQTVSNATLRAHNSASDFALLQLSVSIPTSYRPYFNGWNNVNTASTSSVVIHHPSGDIKKISFDNDAPVSSTWSGTPANSHWRILAYESGTTEGGSSGSPLFDQNHRITGQLHGGTASCSNNIDDYYGKFSMSWAYGSNSTNRLRDWLDPDNTGATILDGLDTLALSVTVTAPNGGETWLVGDANTITWTSVNLSENVRIDLNRAYPGSTWETIVASTANSGNYSWTVSGAATSAARIRITGVTHTTVGDTSNANFTIGTRSVTVTAPNGGETWLLTDLRTITWTSSNLSENVRVDLNRSYPSASWETIVTSTANTGSYAWTVSGATTTTARVRILGVTHTTVGDTSNANFTIAARSLTLTVPNGGDAWQTGELRTIQWTSQNLTGLVNLDINRTYPGGVWESIAASITNSGAYPWTVTGPATTTARIRVTSVDFPAVTDASNANFSIVAPNAPPAIAHDPLHDQLLAAFTVTSNVTDDAPGVTTKLFIRSLPAGTFDSLQLSATGNLNEYAVNVTPSVAGQKEYYLRATDAGGLSASTALYNFWVEAACGSEQRFDDGTAERSNWSQSPGFKWAVKFSPAAPYVLCYARIGISADHPDAAHSQIAVDVYAADGAGGLPGTSLFSRRAGSIGNVIGGVPSIPESYATVFFRDALNAPLSISGDFYIAVSNPDSGFYEAFFEDTTGTLANRSFVFDPCDNQWYSESSGDTSARRGNRMIVASGYSLLPPTDVVIWPVGEDIHLSWTGTGAPFYRVYSSSVAEGPYNTLVGITPVTTFTDPMLSSIRKFYRVAATDNPNP